MGGGISQVGHIVRILLNRPLWVMIFLTSLSSVSSSFHPPHGSEREGYEASVSVVDNALCKTLRTSSVPSLSPAATHDASRHLWHQLIDGWTDAEQTNVLALVSRVAQGGTNYTLDQSHVHTLWMQDLMPSNVSTDTTFLERSHNQSSSSSRLSPSWIDSKCHLPQSSLSRQFGQLLAAPIDPSDTHHPVVQFLLNAQGTTVALDTRAATASRRSRRLSLVQPPSSSSSPLQGRRLVAFTALASSITVLSSLMRVYGVMSIFYQTLGRAITVANKDQDDLYATVPAFVLAILRSHIIRNVLTHGLDVSSKTVLDKVTIFAGVLTLGHQMGFFQAMASTRSRLHALPFVASLHSRFRASWLYQQVVAPIGNFSYVAYVETEAYLRNQTSEGIVREILLEDNTVEYKPWEKALKNKMKVKHYLYNVTNDVLKAIGPKAQLALALARFDTHTNTTLLALYEKDYLDAWTKHVSKMNRIKQREIEKIDAQRKHDAARIGLGKSKEKRFEIASPSRPPKWRPLWDDSSDEEEVLSLFQPRPRRRERWVEVARYVRSSETEVNGHETWVEEVRYSRSNETASKKDFRNDLLYGVASQVFHQEELLNVTDEDWVEVARLMRPALVDDDALESFRRPFESMPSRIGHLSM